MKNVQAVIAVAAAFMASALSSEAVLDVRLSIQNSTDVVLRWPSRATDVFIIAYRPTLDPSTPWTFLDTAYAASSAGAETTYIHPNVVVFPPPEAGEGGGGESPPSPSSSQSTASYSTMTEEEREAYREERYREAQATAKYLMALLEDAVAKADADRERRQKEGTLTSTSQTSATTGESAAVERPLGSMGFYLVTEYSEDIDGDSLPNEFELYLGTSILKGDTDGDGIDDGAEDTDADGSINFEEYIAGTDPVVNDNVTPVPLTDGLVLSGEQIIQFSPNGVNHEGVLCFPDGNLADAIAVDEPTSGMLRIRWHSAFIHYGGFASAASPNDPPPHFDYTAEDRRLLKEAFGTEGGGTSTRAGRLQSVNQGAVDQMRRELLEHLEQVADRRIKIAFQNIQNWNLDPNLPSEELGRLVQREIDMIHTQFVRGGAVNSSLFRRFGRALNRSLPYFGGILILANASAIAENFYNAVQDYALDIRNGDDETGSAAIVAGQCNDLAPGSGNIVLNYLLR
jgi:hypothetical protein